MEAGQPESKEVVELEGTMGKPRLELAEGAVKAAQHEMKMVQNKIRVRSGANDGASRPSRDKFRQ